MTTISSSALSPVAALASTLGHRYRLGLTDGRTIVGRFTCIDHIGNLVIDHALEWAPGHAEEDEGREVGLVLVPQRHWEKVEREDVAGQEGGKGGCVPS